MTPTSPGASSSDPFNFPGQELHRDGGLLAGALARMQASGVVILGEGVRRFEQAFGTWLAAGGEAPDVVGVANGTDALELALRCSGLGSGDRIPIPPTPPWPRCCAWGPSRCSSTSLPSPRCSAFPIWRRCWRATTCVAGPPGP